MKVISVVLSGLFINLLANLLWAYKPQMAATIRRHWPKADKFFNLSLAIIFSFMGIVFIVLSTMSPIIRMVRGSSPCPSATVDKSSGLVGVILEQQRACVGDSVGKWAHESFTDENLKTFFAEKKVEQIVDLLKTNEDFLAVVETIRSLPTSERGKLIAEGAHTCRPTWAQNRTDPDIASVEDLKRGQTEAGSKAECLVAEGITNLARSLMKR